MDNTSSKPVIVHSTFVWLNLTENWIYKQVKHNAAFSCIVFTQATKNLDQFSHNPIYINKTNGNTIVHRALRKFGVLSKYPVFDEAVKRHRPRILHSHFGNMGWLDLPIAQRYGLRHVVTFYGYDVNSLPHQEPVWKERYHELFDRADLFLCEGPHMASCLVELGCPEAKVKVQRLGVELDRIPFVPRTVGEDGLIKILIAGTFREKKGIPYALEAIGMLKEEYPNLRVTLIGDVTGQAREEVEKRKILDVIGRYELEPIVRMLGFVTHEKLMEEVYAHHLFLSPSVTASDGDTEGGSPVTITEVAASGMPVVSTWHCDIPEVVLDKRSGCLVPERDIVGLRDAVERVIASPGEWRQLGMAARRHVENTFGLSRTARELEMAYGALL